LLVTGAAAALVVLACLGVLPLAGSNSGENILGPALAGYRRRDMLRWQGSMRGLQKHYNKSAVGAPAVCGINSHCLAARRAMRLTESDDGFLRGSNGQARCGGCSV
jgi:hypothetical protein